MANWKKINWKTALGKVVFDDELGFIRVGEILYAINGYRPSDLYEEKDGAKHQLEIDSIKSDEMMALFDKKLYVREGSTYTRNGYQYHYKEIIVDKIDLTLSYERNDRSNGYSRRCNYDYTLVISKENKARLKYLRYVWTCNELQDEHFSPSSFCKKPLLKDLRAGDSLLYDEPYNHVLKRCKIVRLLPQPNKDNKMFTAVWDYEGSDNNSFGVSFTGNVYVLPYDEQPVSELAQFNESKNEFDLSPYAVKSGDVVNVYWNKIDDAAQYIVSLYKYYDRPYLQKLYHLKDFIVDRNDGFVSIVGLIEQGNIVTVKAENRNGEEIARSRGIKVHGEHSMPEYF